MMLRFRTHAHRALRRLHFDLADLRFGNGREDFHQAEWLSLRLDKGWRYDHSKDKWFHFDGIRWAEDGERQITMAVAGLAADALAGRNGQPRAEGEERKHLVKLLGVNAQKRALEALSAFRDYSTDGSDWDQNPYLLGCANGIVDLRTGELRPGRPDDLVTKTTGIEYDPDATMGPVTRAFLRDVFMSVDGKEQPDLVQYVLQVLGASLFGHTQPQQFYLALGPGGAGKGTLFHHVEHVLGGFGNYAAKAGQTLYTRGRYGAVSSERPRPDLIALQGRRFAYISEPEPPFDDLMLLAHSGEDKITARGLFSNTVVSWVPSHTIVFSTNKPIPVKEVGTNMRRRFRVIPFVRSFAEHPDTTLADKLAEESTGFLNTLVYAATLYHADPSVLDLDRAPAVVKERSERYLREQSVLGAYLDEVAILDPDAEFGATPLYDAYLTWFARSRQDGEAISQVKFAAELEDTYHLQKHRNNRLPGRPTMYRGIRLRPNWIENMPDEGESAA